MEQILINAKQVTDSRQFKWGLDYIIPYQVYFHMLQNGDFNCRVITAETNEKWLEQEIRNRRIYLPAETIKAERK